VHSNPETINAGGSYLFALAALLEPDRIKKAHQLLTPDSALSEHCIGLSLLIR
jgi:hypothetical protein